MFKSVNSKFYTIVIMLLALYGLGCMALVYFFHEQSHIYTEIDHANKQKESITKLSESFYKARFLEKEIINQTSPEAEKKFVLMLQDMRRIIHTLRISVPHENSESDLDSVLKDIDRYENLVSGIIQLKTETRLLDTKLSTLFQSMTATILQEKNSELLRPMFSVAHFFNSYMKEKQDSQQKALSLVTQSLEFKVSSQEQFDVRLIDYMQDFRSILQSNYEIMAQIRAANDEAEFISINFHLKFEQFIDTIRQGIAELLKKLNQHKKNLQYAIPVSVVLTVVLLFLIIYLLKNNIISPIKAIARTMAEVESGNRSARFDTSATRKDEIMDVGLSLNKMLEVIEERDTTLRGYQLTLEKQLEELSKQKAEQERLTQQLRRAEKMEAIGTLAGGVAHDLNNILSGIVSYPELLLLQIDDNSPFKKPLQTIQQSGNKAAAIVQDLLTLARRGAAIFETVNLNTIVRNYLKSPECKKLIVEYPLVGIKTILDENLFNIKGSPIHLLKTVMNLVTNGLEAVREEGRLTIQTENRYISQQIVGYDEIKEGDYAVLIVKDTGSGIVQDDLEKIFEPFFSRKTMGRSGSGLGLAVVWGTIKDHNGYIDVYSNEMEGTTFTLYFPITSEEVENLSQAKAVDLFRGKGETVLVVDDVESQREIATSILKKLGYDALTASSGEEAVAMIKQQPVDLVVLDMLMPPGMDGLDTYRKILEIYPEQKVIIASGYSENERVHSARRLGVRGYIHKPYSLEMIGNTIHAVIIG